MKNIKKNLNIFCLLLEERSWLDDSNYTLDMSCCSYQGTTHLFSIHSNQNHNIHKSCLQSRPAILNEIYFGILKSITRLLKVMRSNIALHAYCGTRAH